MKKVLSGIAVVAMLCLVSSVSRAQDTTNGEKGFKAKCTGKQELEKGEHRAMDCIDCYNRPTHAFELRPF